MPYPQHISELVPKRIESLYQGRFNQFTDLGQYSNLNLPACYDRERDGHLVKLQVYSVPDLARPSFNKALKHAKWQDVSVGDLFGPSWSTHWFKVTLRIPPKWKKHSERAVFEFDSSDEGFIYLASGEPQVSLSAENNRREWILPEEWYDGEKHVFYVETACNDMQGNGGNDNRQFRLNMADVVVPNAEARALHIDFWIIGDAARELPGDSWVKNRAFDVLNRIVNVFDIHNADESIAKGRAIAQEFLGCKVDSPKVYGDIKGNLGAPSTLTSPLVYAMGNCHIDTAWLWPYAETRRKIARSWATQLDLLERYPEYQFFASQAVQFLWLKQDHPDLFKRVQKAVKGGRFVPIGGSWVECDTNMPSGEALVRQTLLGQTFFRTEFGESCKTFWLPDTFGYSPQLPQVCRLAGMDRFLTQKLSWNNVNVFPNTTFNWVGIDGSQVLCHMPPANTYTAQAHFGDVRRSLVQHKNLDTEQHSLLLFGNGDGGGGPTSEMLEKLRRCRGLSDTVGELPRVHLGRSVDEFYDEVLASSDGGKSLVSWVGELYLEYHRGTYTTQAAIKNFNRRSEVLLHDIELLATVASLASSKYKYPYEAIAALWQDVCLNQFHDVLPGSGIGWIYKDAKDIYRKVFSRGIKLLGHALKVLGYEFDTKGTVRLNTLPWTRHNKLVGYAASCALVDRGHEPVPVDIECPVVYDMTYNVQAQATEVTEATEASVTEVSATEVEPKEAKATEVLGKDENVLENSRFKAVFERGELVSLYDKSAQRAVLVPKTRSNRLVVFEDQPMNFPAWDTEQYATEKGVYLSATRTSQPNPETLVNLYHFGKSKIKVTTNLRADRLVFTVQCDWHETYQFLKAEFNVDVVNSNANYETQFGFHQRPTHYNTSWDAAKFETCGHKFADLSELNYGVALINENKYGYSIHGKTMRLSLLRAPKCPDPGADMGYHAFSYALYPHEGPLSADVVRAGYEFNYPLIPVTQVAKKARRHKLFSVKNASNVVLVAVKRAEADFGAKSTARHVILRLYESLGGTTRARIVSAKPVRRVLQVSTLEEELEELDVVSGEQDYIEVTFKPFEVVTLKLEME